jgi:two-component sensor histidine kinase
MKGLLFCCFLLLLTIPSKAQHLTVAQADSLKRLLQPGKADTSQIGFMLRLSDYYQRKTWNAGPNRDSALVLAKKARELSQPLNYVNGLETAVFLEGRILIKQEKIYLVRQLMEKASPINYVRLTLELGKQQLLDTRTQKADWDSALSLFQQAEKLSERLKNPYWQEESQLLLGMTYLLKKEEPLSKAYFTQVIQARQRAGDKAGELTALLKTITFSMHTVPGCTGSACAVRLSALNRALALSRQLKDQAREEIVLILVGAYYASQGDLKSAERLAHEALAIQKQIGYRAINRTWHALMDESAYHQQSTFIILSHAAYLLTDINEARLDLNQALLNYLQVIKDIEQSGLLEELAFPYFFLGMTYFNLNQLDKSLVYYQQSLAVSHQKGEVMVVNGLIRSLTEVMLKQGKAQEALQVLNDFTSQDLPIFLDNKILLAIQYAQCYSALGQDQQAEQQYRQAIAWSKQSTRSSMETYAKYYASQFYVETGQYKKAEPLLQRVLSWLTDNKELSLQYKEAHLLQFKVDSAQARYPSAMQHYQRYTALKDSTFNEAKSKQIEQLTIQYETSKKDQDLKLQKQNIALLQEQNMAQQTQRNALIGGTILLLSLLGLGYNRYRIKQISSRKLEGQQKEINAKNISLQHLVTEKEWLLKEIHHRVKNNLQIVMSLLNSQSAYLEDDAAMLAIRDSQHRVQAISLIHQKLYQSDNLSAIAMQLYIGELVEYLRDFFDTGQRIRFDTQIEAIALDVSYAVPLGLILNEAITNGIKYAFPLGREGLITIAFKHRYGHRYLLSVSDNGVGLPANFDSKQTHSLGMSLMRGLSEEIDGSFSLESHQGTALFIDFVYEPTVKQDSVPLNAAIPSEMSYE